MDFAMHQGNPTLVSTGLSQLYLDPWQQREGEERNITDRARNCYLQQCSSLPDCETISFFAVPYYVSKFIL